MPQSALKGEIISWHEARGFGFIASATGGEPVFVHINDFKGTKRIPYIGQRRSCVMAVDKQSRPCAKQVVFESQIKSTFNLKNALLAFNQQFLLPADFNRCATDTDHHHGAGVADDFVIDIDAHNCIGA